MTGFIASIVEAFIELRVGKTRILLSLIGVAVSVFALTTVLAAGGMLRDAMQQQADTQSGRAATIEIYVSARYDETTGMPVGEEPDAEQTEDAVQSLLERYQIPYASRILQASDVRLQTGHGAVTPETMRAVDPDYGDMYRVRPSEGRWFADSDEGRLAPAVVVNEAAYADLGSPDLDADPTVTLYRGDGKATAVVIGVVPDMYEGEGDNLYMLVDDYRALAPTKADDASMGDVSYEAWVPEDGADEMAQRMMSDMQAQFPDYQTDAYRVDQAQYMDEEFGAISKVIMGVALFVLVLGALGLMNISLVTVKYRVREIGIRRSYGATSLRVFVGVLMESVVATFVAGAIGVILSVLVLRMPFTTRLLGEIGLVDIPPFPISAALIGLGTATAVGFLAGVIPALLAVRIRVIDAIRY